MAIIMVEVQVKVFYNSKSINAYGNINFINNSCISTPYLNQPQLQNSYNIQHITYNSFK
jgi:hypothetical protein